MSLTEAGRDFYESAVLLISDLEAAESRIGSGQASPSGVVRVTAAPGFSRRYVVPKLPSFRARYPKVVVEMLVSHAERVPPRICDGKQRHFRGRIRIPDEYPVKCLFSLWYGAGFLASL